jgi:hypothetical protein
MLYQFPTHTHSKGPVEKGLLRHKNRIGNSWAGRVLNNQDMHSTPNVTQGAILANTHNVYQSNTTYSKITAYSFLSKNYKLVIYKDNSALLIKEEGPKCRVAPLPLYIPKSACVNGQNITLPLIEWCEPCESPLLDIDVARQIQHQLQSDILFWIEFWEQLPVVADARQGLDCPDITPWFHPLRTHTSEDHTLMNKFLKGVTRLFEPQTSLTLQGRTLTGNAKITAPVAISKNTNSTFWTQKSLKLIADCLESPYFPVPKKRQIRQGFSARTQKNSGYGSMVGLTLASSDFYTVAQSSHKNIELLQWTNALLTRTHSPLMKDI